MGHPGDSDIVLPIHGHGRSFFSIGSSQKRREAQRAVPEIEPQNKGVRGTAECVLNRIHQWKIWRCGCACDGYNVRR